MCALHEYESLPTCSGFYSNAIYFIVAFPRRKQTEIASQTRVTEPQKSLSYCSGTHESYVRMLRSAKGMLLDAIGRLSDYVSGRQPGNTSLVSGNSKMRGIMKHNSLYCIYMAQLSASDFHRNCVHSTVCPQCGHMAVCKTGYLSILSNAVMARV